MAFAQLMFRVYKKNKINWWDIENIWSKSRFELQNRAVLWIYLSTESFWKWKRGEILTGNSIFYPYGCKPQYMFLRNMKCNNIFESQNEWKEIQLNKEYR